jgi:hypothetical protein
MFDHQSALSNHWSKQVNWLLVDDLTRKDAIAENASLEQALQEASAIVYCLGSLFNNSQYKEFLKSISIGSSPLAVAFSSLGSGSISALSLLNASNGALYSLNYRTAINVASKTTDGKPFVYVSADPRAFTIPFMSCNPLKDYLESKKMAEKDLASLTSNCKPLIFRPGKFWSLLNQVIHNTFALYVHRFHV